jgi:hypothetical protein
MGLVKEIYTTGLHIALIDLYNFAFNLVTCIHRVTEGARNTHIPE